MGTTKEASGGDKSGTLSGQLAKSVEGLAGSAGKLAMSVASDKLTKATSRLTEYAAGSAGSGLLGALTGSQKKGLVGAVVSHGVDKAKQALTGGGGNGDGQGKGQQLKVTNIVEQFDIGAPVRVCYDQWTRFTDFPTFMKKVENIEQESDEKLNWRAQIFMSHRMWEATIVEQVPDRRIVWRSKGDKGHVDGAVTFHELAPELTRMVVILEYHPKGFFEKTANIWRAQGRRARLELKHFARHVMTQAVLHPEEIEGWRGEIHDGQVAQDKEGGEKPEAPQERPSQEKPSREQSSQRQESGDRPKAGKQKRGNGENRERADDD